MKFCTDSTASGKWPQVVLEVPEVWTRFEIITSPVRNDVRVKDMHFAYAPAVEPVFVEQVVKDGFVADLDIPEPGADPTHCCCFGYGSRVRGMGHPGYGSGSAGAFQPDGTCEIVRTPVKSVGPAFVEPD